ncbi:hypothetical protein IL54_4087 [Sphingobium sp. ba1]|nr:hypothetical protein IL54_4087 [Sphingobium sp. ba1]
MADAPIARRKVVRSTAGWSGVVEWGAGMDLS